MGPGGKRMLPSQNSFRNFGCSLVASCIKSARGDLDGWIDWALLEILIRRIFHPGVDQQHRGFILQLNNTGISTCDQNKSRKTVQEQLEVLVEAEIVESTTIRRTGTRGLPWKFYSFTERGADILREVQLPQGCSDASGTSKRASPKRSSGMRRLRDHLLFEPVRVTFRIDEEEA